MKKQILSNISLVLVLIITLTAIGCKKDDAKPAAEEQQEEESNNTATISGMWTNKTLKSADITWITTIQFGDNGAGNRFVLEDDGIGRVVIAESEFDWNTENDETLTLELTDNTTEVYEYTIDATGDKLTLTSSSGEVKVFTRDL